MHNVALSESRARFEEAYDIITRAWTEEVFSYEGKFWSYKDVAMWPRPVQRPHPPIWVPVVGSKESIEFAGRHNLPITPGLGRARGLRDDIIRFYAKCLSAAGHRITPDHLSLGITAYVADSKAQALKEYGPHILYFNRTLFSHGNFTETEMQRQTGYSTAGVDRLRAAGEISRRRQSALQVPQSTMRDLEEQAEHMPLGTADEVIHLIIAAADSAGAHQVQLAINRGALPHDLFMAQIERFAREGAAGAAGAARSRPCRPPRRRWLEAGGGHRPSGAGRR